MKLFKSLMTATVLVGTALSPILAHAGAFQFAKPFQPAGLAADLVEQVDFKVKKKAAKDKKW